MLSTENTRRYDVDWLRIIALGVLIFYHLGMYYVADWEWHLKSSNQSEFLQDLMLLVNPWRMSLLFFISGMTLALIQPKYDNVSLIRIRWKRLGIPLIFGMLVIVPPQLYYELKSSIHYSQDYVDFYLHYIDINTALAPHKQSVLGLITWNHLWYLAYLLVYTFIYILFSPLLTRVCSSNWFRHLSPVYLLLAAFLLLFLVKASLRSQFEVTNALLDDWYNHARYFLMLLCGFMLVSHKTTWFLLEVYWKRCFMIACCTFSFGIMDKHGYFSTLASLYDSHLTVRALYYFNSTLNTWAWICTAIGAAAYYLNKPHRYLAICNESVLPIYILHQTLIILFAVWLAPFTLPPLAEAFVIVLLVLCVSAAAFQLIRRINLLRFLFGLSPNKTLSGHPLRLRPENVE
ncbi:acyltransferase family protein [Aestuariibacter sp. AA17]|uniref:Acyltransferase family protein n=1 Tax=Fluctibacter corallii TaxID=2984329 RepID=A0ABT3ABQ7_9ALTE|nr:acyltransferase family protein [Aestuariibacter sp. AA17]MCV2886118.1 acyltransferase family protein [Aestuariibacter sp. AA17]